MKIDVLSASFLQELDLFISQNYVEDDSVKIKGLFADPNKEISEEIQEFTKVHKKSFIETLNEMLKKYNESKKEKFNDVDLYKKANVSRQTYHKLLEKDRPSKDTAVMYSLALELCEKDMEKLLASAGYSLATNSKRDLILKFCFMREKYDYAEVCNILKIKEEKLLRNV
jgi:hypothetical protein